MPASYRFGEPQIDGKRRVIETHIDAFGVERVIEYGPVGAVNYDAVLAGRAAVIDAQNIAEEIAGNISRVLGEGARASILIRYAAMADFTAALREAYRAASRVDAAMIGDYLNSLTDAQLRVAFSMTAAQVSNLRTTRLVPAADAVAKIDAAAGV